MDAHPQPARVRAPALVPGGRGPAARAPRGPARASTEFAPRAYYISAQSRAPEACWQWLVYLSGRPETVDLLPARRSVAESAAWQEQVEPMDLPAYLATLEFEDASILRLRWQVRWLAYASPWLDGAFEAVLGGADVELALGEAQAKAEALWACLEAERGVREQRAAARLRAAGRSRLSLVAPPF